MLDRWVQATLEWEEEDRTELPGHYSWHEVRDADFDQTGTWPAEYILWTMAGPVSHDWIAQGHVNGKQGVVV